MKISTGISIGAVALLLVSYDVWSALPSRESLKAKRVTHAALSLPIGSTKAQVAALLHKEGMEASYVHHKEGTDFDSDVINNRHTSSNLDDYYIAVIHNTSGGFLNPVSGDTCYSFFFNKKERLIKVTIKELLTGP